MLEFRKQKKEIDSLTEALRANTLRLTKIHDQKIAEKYLEEIKYHKKLYSDKCKRNDKRETKVERLKTEIGILEQRINSLRSRSRSERKRGQPPQEFRDEVFPEGGICDKLT